MPIAHQPTERLIAAVLAGDVPAWPFGDDAAAADRFLAACRDEGLGPLLHYHLARHERGRDWPELVRAALAADARIHAAWDLLREREVVAVVEMLGTAGIESVLLKGTPLAYTHYPEPALRTRSDTDLFIRTSDRARAAALMRAAGYVRVHGVAGELVSYQESFHRSDAQIDHIFDLHWQINNGQVFAQAVPFEEALANSVAVPALGASAKTLSAPYALLLACMHRAAHIGTEGPGSERLLWLVDIDVIGRAMRAPEWERFLELCSEKQMRTVSAAALRRATQLLGTVVSERVLDALRDVPAGEPSAVYLTGGPRDILRANLRALPTWRARLTLLHEMSMPPPAFMRTAHAGANRWTLPWLYLRRAWRGFARSRRP